MDEVKKVKLYTWKYDNGAWGYAVKQKKKGDGWKRRAMQPKSPMVLSQVGDARKY